MHIQEHCFYADTEFLYYAGLAARTIEFNDSCAYQYRLGTAGQSVSAEGIYKHIEDLLKIEYHLMQLYHQDRLKIQSQVRKKYLFAIIDTRYFMLFNCFIVIIQKCDKDRYFAHFIRETKKNFPDIVKQCHLPVSYSLVSNFPELLIPFMRTLKSTKVFHLLKNIK